MTNNNVKNKKTLQECNSKLTKEWDYDKNSFSPKEVMANSGKKVWWKCSVCGYEWEAVVASRNYGSGCPNCAKALHTSAPEQILYFYINKYFPDALNSYKPNWLPNKSEIDIFIPSLNLAIEYDGNYWHKDVEKDKRKDRIVKDNNCTLIRFREKGTPKLNSTSKCIYVEQTNKDYSFLTKPLKDLFCFINETYNMSIIPNININDDYLLILSLYEKKQKEQSLLNIFPQIASEWDYEKNKGLTPDMLTFGSNRKVWWKCENGHSWKSDINTRTSGQNCPYCSGRRVLEGYNDLGTVRPELVKEWNYEKNLISPKAITEHSGKKVWWKCSACGYEWQAQVMNRSNGSGCPICSTKEREQTRIDNLIENGRQTISSNHILMSEWHAEKNKNLDPKKITIGSNKKVWWKCSICGYEWQAQVINRSHGTGCPKCKGKKISKSEKETRLKKGENDLASVSSLLTSEWVVNKNYPDLPENINCNSHKKVWWKCSICGYEWQATVKNRNNGSGCPVCAGKIALLGHNDFFSLYPNLVKDWNYEKNDDINPKKIVCGSHSKVWWKCSKCGYEWQTEVRYRIKHSKCPKCKN